MFYLKVSSSFFFFLSRLGNSIREITTTYRKNVQLQFFSANSPEVQNEASHSWLLQGSVRLEPRVNCCLFFLP